MKAYVFPGQGSQFPGMGQDLYNSNAEAKKLFHQANDLLGFEITDVMFNGSIEILKQTLNAQLAIYIHSVIATHLISNFKPSSVAGHSIGEFSALTAAGALSFEDGLALVEARARAMQAACTLYEGTMAAILGGKDKDIEDICAEIDNVYPANYNCPGQLVISGLRQPVAQACEKSKNGYAKKAIELQVAGAFHTKFMLEAEKVLAKKLLSIQLKAPLCPVYTNIDAAATTCPQQLSQKITKQVTAPVLWTQTILKMREDGVTTFEEIGPGKTLSRLIRKILS